MLREHKLGNTIQMFLLSLVYRTWRILSISFGWELGDEIVVPIIGGKLGSLLEIEWPPTEKAHDFVTHAFFVNYAEALIENWPPRTQLTQLQACVNSFVNEQVGAIPTV